MHNTLSFILLKGHKKRVRNAAVRWSSPKLTAVENPALYSTKYNQTLVGGLIDLVIQITVVLTPPHGLLIFNETEVV